MIESDIKRRINALRTEFQQGGIADPLTVIEQISFLTYARLLDIDETRDHKLEKQTGRSYANRFKDNEQHLRWSQIRQLKAEEMLPIVRDEVFRHLRSSTANGDTFFKLMKDAKLMIQDPRLLAKVIEIIDELPLAESGTKGDLYEYLLSMLTTIGTNGQFRTPRHIAKLMIELVEPNLWDDDGNPLYPVIGDPSCGTGGFLVSVIDYLLETNFLSKATIEEADSETGAGDLLEEHRKHIREGMVHGFDSDVIMLRFAAINLLLHGVDASDIHCQDTLGSDFFEKFPTQASEGFDIIFSNPPFKGTSEFKRVHYSLLQQIKTRRTELLFLVLVLRMLKKGGRSAVIVPDSVVSEFSHEHRQLRRLLVEQNRLEALISLPSGVFRPYASTPTDILVFTKGGHTDKVFFYDVRADGRSLDDMRQPVDDNDLPDCLAHWRSRHGAEYTDRASKAFFVQADEIRSADYVLSLNHYKEPASWEDDYEPPRVILERIEALNKEINQDTSEMEEMLG